jgi:hypothetical protein
MHLFLLNFAYDCSSIMTFTPPVRNVSIHDINLVLLRKKERLCSKISGCTVTLNGKFIFADYSEKELHIRQVVVPLRYLSISHKTIMIPHSV